MGRWRRCWRGGWRWWRRAHWRQRTTIRAREGEDFYQRHPSTSLRRVRVALRPTAGRRHRAGAKRWQRVGAVVERRRLGAVAVGTVLDAGERKPLPMAEARAVLAAGVGVPLSAYEVRQAPAARPPTRGAAALKAFGSCVLAEAGERGPSHADLRGCRRRHCPRSSCAKQRHEATQGGHGHTRRALPAARARA